MKRYIISAVILLATLSACEDNTVSDREPVEIALAAAIQNVSVGTRAPYTLTVPNAYNPVTSAIWASTVSGSYQGTQSADPSADPPDSSAEDIDYHNTTSFTSGDKQLLDHQLFYPENKKTVYFIGLCPRSESGWQVEESVPGSGKYDVAMHIFDGKTDVMFAREKNNNIEKSSILPILEYRHVLTWIKIKVVADNQDAIDAWGKVQKITIASNDRIKINLSTNICTFDSPNTSFPTYCFKDNESTDVPFQAQAITLTTTPQEVAYTLCCAVPASAGDTDNEYSITIDTQRRKNTTVPINLKSADGTSNFEGNTEGCQFTVTLRFKLGENIVTTARATEWINGGVGVASIEE